LLSTEILKFLDVIPKVIAKDRRGEESEFEDFDGHIRDEV